MRKLLLPLRSILGSHRPCPPRPHTTFLSSSCSIPWRLQGGVSSAAGSGGGLRLLTSSSTALKRMLGASVGSTRMRVLMLRFSLQRRGPFYGSFLRQTNGWRSFMSTSDGVLYGLIGANVAVFFLWRIVDSTLMTRHFTISLSNIMNWRVHTLLTSGFSHMSIDHIFTNMIGLYFFGNSIGQLFGPHFLLKMYIAGAVTGSIFYLVHTALSVSSFKGIGKRYYYGTPALGASGAVNSIMLFYIFLFPRNTIYLQFFVPVPAALVGAILIGSDFWRVKKGDETVSGAAHLGGALVAALVWARMIKRWI